MEYSNEIGYVIINWIYGKIAVKIEFWMWQLGDCEAKADWYF